MSQLILVVEDEKPIADIVKFNLERAGYAVEVAYDGREALEKAFRLQPDLVLLDLMLPKLSGIEVCKHLRSAMNTPILMVTAKATESDKINGLELGADDYITKPFSPRELLARVKAALRRVTELSPQMEQSSSLSIAGLEIDFAKYRVSKRGEAIELTVREYELLKYLALSPGTVFDREQLLKEVWGYDYFGHVRTVDVTVRRLREKIEDDPSQPAFILMRRGVGYYFREV